jgi:hypothetical protein
MSYAAEIAMAPGSVSRRSIFLARDARRANSTRFDAAADMSSSCMKILATTGAISRARGTTGHRSAGSDPHRSGCAVRDTNPLRPQQYFGQSAWLQHLKASNPSNVASTCHGPFR